MVSRAHAKKSSTFARDPLNIVLTTEDLVDACRSQESHLSLDSMWRRIVRPSATLADIHLTFDDLRRARSIARRLIEISSTLALFDRCGVRRVPGPKIMIQAATSARASQIAQTLAGELFKDVCVISARTILTQRPEVHSKQTMSDLIEEVISTHHATGKLVVIEDAGLLFEESDESASTTQNDDVRDVILSHPAPTLFACSNEFRVTRELIPSFIDIFSESTDATETRIGLWIGILNEFSLELNSDISSLPSTALGLDPDEIRRVVLSTWWEAMRDQPTRCIPLPIILKHALRMQQTRHKRSFDFLRGSGHEDTSI